MSQSTLVSDLQALVATPSVNPFDGPAETPPPEDAMARLYEQRLAELGLELGSQTVIDGRRNVWGRLRGSACVPAGLFVVKCCTKTGSCMSLELRFRIHAPIRISDTEFRNQI